MLYEVITIKISNISADFLQDTRAWIVMPAQVEFYISKDNVNFERVAVVKNTIDPKENEVLTQKLTAEVSAQAKYVKVIARNFGKLPEWHISSGNDAFIFIDEIEVN